MAAGRSAASLLGLQGIGAVERPEIVVPFDTRLRTDIVAVHQAEKRVVMPRRVAGFPCSGVEFTLLRLATVLDDYYAPGDSKAVYVKTL